MLTIDNVRPCVECVPESMVNVVEVYRSMPDVIDGVCAIFGKRTLLVMPNAVAESAGVCKGLGGKDWDDLKTLESDIMPGTRFGSAQRSINAGIGKPAYPI